MYNTDFSSDQSIEKKDYLSHQVELLSKPSAIADPDQYELVSRQRAMLSRQILGELDEESAFSIYLYGRFGLSLNYSLRDEFNASATMKVNTLSMAQHLIRLFREKFNLSHKDNLYQLDKKTIDELKKYLQWNYRGATSRAFRKVIDETIENYSPRFTKSHYLYRISKVKKNTYTPPSEVLEPKLRKIEPGDIIMDESFTSSATRADAVIFRYSRKGQSATYKKAIPDSEEEVLFMIENNESLKVIDISGYKFPKSKEKKTSGEMLIKSQTKFKVTGIQKSDPRFDRRIVILEPISDAQVKVSDAIKNPYSGAIYPSSAQPTHLDRASLPPPPPPPIPSPSPSPSTIGATATEAIVPVTEIGGATGGRLSPEF